MNQVEVKRRQIQAFSYILGLVGLLALGKLLEDNGVAYIAAAYECFSLIWILTGKCSSDAMSKMLRVRNSKGQYKNIAKVRRRLMGIRVFMGILGAAVLAVGGFILIDDGFQMQNGAFLALVLVPAFLLRNINAGILGFFQGEGAELPTSVSSVLRAVFTIGFGFLFGILLKNYGVKVSALLLQSDFTGMYAAFGVAVAFSVAELFILLFLIVIYKGSSHNAKAGADGGRAVDSVTGLTGILYSNMAGMILIMLLRELPVWLGLLFFRKNTASAAAAVPDSLAITLYGTYYGKYLALMFIAILIIDIMLISQSARVYALFRREDIKFARNSFQGGIHVAIIWGAYISVAFAALSGQIAEIFCSTNTDNAASMLQGGSFLILFVVLADYFGRLLYLSDKKYMIYAGLGIMNIVFVIFATVFLNAADMGIMSLVFGGLIASAVLCGVLGFCALKSYGMGIDIVQNIGIPAGCACVSGLICLFLGKAVTPHLGNAVTVLLCIIVSLAVYLMLLLVTHNFHEHELRGIPGGRVIRALGQLFHLL